MRRLLVIWESDTLGNILGTLFALSLVGLVVTVIITTW